MPDKDANSQSGLADAKKRVSARLMPLDYISGVGTSGSGLTVYLARPLAPDEERHVKSVIETEAADKPVDFVKSGEFKAR